MKPRGGIFAFICALAFAGVITLWIRSPRHGDAVAIFGSGGKVGGVLSIKGELLIVFSNIELGEHLAWTAQTLSAGPESAAGLRESLLDTPRLVRRMKFTIAAQPRDAMGVIGGRTRVIGVPHALPAVLLAIAPLIWTRQRWRRWRWKRGGCCVDCGYDLRESAGRCPECGREG